MLYGISQNPNTKDYIIILCQDCVYFSGNKKIDNLIKEMHLRIKDYNDIVFVWVPYNQLDNIKEISKGDYATVHSAIWKDGPLYYNHKGEYIRKSDKKVTLKYLYNSQNITDGFLNEVLNFFYQSN